MVTMAQLTETDFNKLLYKQEVFREKAYALLQEGSDLFNVITYATQKQDHVTTRYEKVHNLIAEMLND